MRSTWFIVAVGVFVVIQIIANIGKNTENKQDSARNANITVNEKVNKTNIISQPVKKEENTQTWAETYKRLCNEQKRLTKWRDDIAKMKRSHEETTKKLVEARKKRAASGKIDWEFEKIYREMDKLSDDTIRDSQNILDIEKRSFNDAVEGWNLQVEIFLTTSYARTVDTTVLQPMAKFY